MTFDPFAAAPVSPQAKGRGTLAGGAVSVAAPVVQADSVVVVTPLAPLVNLGLLSVANVVPGMGFDVRSANVLDGSSFLWAVL